MYGTEELIVWLTFFTGSNNFLIREIRNGSLRKGLEGDSQIKVESKKRRLRVTEKVFWKWNKDFQG